MMRVTKRAWVIVISAAVLQASCKQKEAPAPAKPVATSQPATKPAATKPTEVASYIDYARKLDHRIAATQPLIVPVNLDEAICLVTSDPVYVCPAGNIWITRSNAPPTDVVLKEMAAPDE